MSTDGEAAGFTAVGLVAAYRARTLSPVEAVDAVLARIARLNPQLNAFCLVDAEGARRAARESEARWAKGAPIGVLDGVPATVKDILLTRGWPTLRGSRTVAPDQPWEEDAPTVARLREAGAILLGKTTTPEFGWKALGDSPLTGVTRNPWNPDHTPGGSSAGAAAGVAAGLGPLALGTDGGGSIRIPASFSGIFGLKPSFGRVPAYPVSPFGLVAHVGPMARTAADAALMMQVIAQPDDRDPYALPPDPVDYAAALAGGLRGLRIGYSPRLGHATVEPEVAAAVEAAARRLAELGAIVEPAEPGFDSPRDAFWTLWTTGAAKVVSALSDAQRALVDPGLRAAAEGGRVRSALDWLAADAARAALGQTMARFFRRHDLLMTPSVAVPAPRALRDDPAHDLDWIAWTPFSYPFNMTRHPAASVPCGLTRAGLPVGFQLVGRPYADATVLRAAHAYQEAAPPARPAI